MKISLCLRAALNPRRFLFASALRSGGGGVDISPLAESGAVLMSLVPDSQRYFEAHHSGLDTMDKINARELELPATAIALMVYLMSEEFSK